jgi:hypothetical protein
MNTDFALCNQKDCPRFSICVRADQRPTRWPSNFHPDYGENGCQYFILIHGEKLELADDEDET